MYLASNIKWIRELKGQTQEEFAKIIGIGRSNLGQIEAGNHKPNRLVQHKIAHIAGITIDELNEKNLEEYTVNVLNPDTKEVDYRLTSEKGKNQQTELELIKKELEMTKEMLEREREHIQTLKQLISNKTQKS